MTLLEYVQSLQDQGVPEEQWIQKVQIWKKENEYKAPKVEIAKTPSEKVKTEVVAEKDATAATTPVASESSSSGSGTFQLDPIADFNLDVINQKAERKTLQEARKNLQKFEEKKSDFNKIHENVFGKSIEEFEEEEKQYKQDQIEDILGKYSIGSDERTIAYKQLDLAPDDTINKKLYEDYDSYIKDREKLVEKVKEVQEGDAYGIQGLPKVDFSKVGEALGKDTKDYNDFVASVENLDQVSDYIEKISKEKIEPKPLTIGQRAAGAFLVNIPLGLEDAWETSKATAIDFIDKSMKAMGQTPEFLIEAKAKKDPNAIEFVDPETNERVLFSENPGKWKDLKDRRLSGEDIPSFMAGYENLPDFLKGEGEEEIGRSAENYIINQFKKSEALNRARINVGTFVKEFDITKPFETKFASGNELIGGIFDTIGGFVSTAIPAALTRGASIFPQIAAPMYVDYNIEKAKSLYGDSPESIGKLVRNRETEIITPLALGGIAAGLEYVGLKGIAKNLIGKTGIMKPFVSMILTQNKEGLTELGQLGTEALNKGLASGKSLSDSMVSALKVMTSKEGVNNYLMGFAGAGITTAPSTIGKALITETEVFNSAAKHIKNISSLQLQRSQNKNKDFRKAIDIQIQETESSLKDLLENTNKLANTMTREEQSRVLDLLNEKTKNNETLEGLNNSFKMGELTAQQYGSAKGALVNKNKKLSNEVSRVLADANTRIIETEVETVKKFAGEDKVKVYNTINEFVEATGQDPDFDAFINPDTGEIFINKERAAKVGSVTAGSHELLHKIIKQSFSDPETAARLVEDFKSILSTKELAVIQKRIDENYSDQSSEVQNEEFLTSFSDAIGTGELTWSDNLKETFMRLAKPILNIFRGKGYASLEFESGRDVYDFIKDYQKNIKKGKISKRAELLSATGEVDMGLETEVDLGDVKASKKDTGAVASAKVQEIYDTQGEAGAFDIIEQFKPIVKKIVDKRQDAPNFDRQLLTDEIETGKRGIFDLIREYNPESGVPLAAYINKFLPARAIEASQRVLGEEFTSDVTEAKGVMAEEVTTEVAEKPITRKIKPSSLISNDAAAKIKEQVQQKIKDIDPNNLTFKKLGDLAPEIIAAEIGIPVKKLTDPKANLSKGDATAIQQFINKNADKLLKILPEGAVIEAATEKLLGTSTGVPKGLLNAFYTKQARLGKGAGLAPFKLNKGISKADFLETFGIVEGKKAEGFDARSPQAQALKGIAGLYGKLVTNEIVRSDTDLSLEAKQDVAAGKSKAMASKRFDLAKAKDISSTPFAVELVKKTTTRTTSRGKEVKIKVTDLDSKEMQEFTSIVNSFLSKYPQHGPYFRQGYTGTKQTHTYGEVSIFDEYVPGFKGVEKPITRLGYSKSRFQSAKTINSAIPTLKADNKARIGLLKDIALDIETFLSIKGNENKGYVFDQFFKDGSRDQNHPLRYLIPLKFATVDPISLKITTNEEITEEHTSPVVGIGRLIMDAAKNGNVEQVFTEVIEPSAAQGGLLRSIDENMSSSLKQDQANEFYEKVLQLYKEGKLDSVKDALWYIRYSIENDVNPFSIMLLENGITVGEYFLGKTDVSKVGLVETQSIANNLINDILTGEITQKQAKQEFKIQQENLLPGKAMASKRDSDLIPDAIKYDRPITVQTAINALAKTDKALENGRKLNAPVKKIRVFDFDDTLARTKSNVLYTMPDGTTGAIDAATFAKEAGNMEAEGAQWDFSEFSKVMQGKKGPLLDVAKIIAEKRGTKDVFVLTARPANAAGPIKEFLASMGLNIPLANITGLGDGTPQAKAGWIMGKAAEGYNDFYFADDHTGNVKAVKDVLSQIDVKSKVQLAKASKRQTFDTVVNNMIEDSSGIEAYKKYSAARAKTVGASKGKYAFLIPPSAEDFTGLLYKMIGKGNKGDAQMAFLKTNLLDTYDRAESAVTQAKISAANDFKALKTKLKTLPKTLSKETGIGKFTYSHAVRVAAWTKQGMDIPGLSKRDIKELNDFVNKDAKLRVFTDELIKIQKGKEYPAPGKDWLGGNITTDIIGGINKVNRAEYQQEWRENIDIIFSEDNLNKMEAAYGTRWREAIEDSIRRMKAGTNRPIGGNRVTEGLLDWLNNSVGAVMFLNTRSALLQTISAVNFINWGDNNIVKAGAAFANQKQFWGDFMTLMNSDYLVERRNGLKINVSESEIADAVRESKNKPKAAIAFLLSKGFVMTRFADSFAIASGGSTFYRNRLESLKKQGLSEDEAKTKAFADFKAVAEESQQSSAPSKISQQQASAAGRVILAWANTPMQYARIQKRAAQDLINNRGDWRSNVSKIVYYGAVQNLIFNALQQAVFALGFGDDDETDEDKAKKKEEKAYKVANGMIDSQLKGLGIFGAASTAVKNTLITLYEEYSKKGSKYENAVDDLLSFSPPLGSKIGKIKGGLKSFSWNMKDMKEKGFSLDNPAYIAGAQVVTGFTNIPLDRVAKKINNLRGLVNERSSLWQKVALGLGWGTWELGLGYYGGFDKQKPLTPKQQLQLEVDTIKKDTSKADQVKTLLDFGLTKKQIRELKNENDRVKKILELQKKDKDAGSKK